MYRTLPCPGSPACLSPCLPLETRPQGLDGALQRRVLSRIRSCSGLNLQAVSSQQLACSRLPDSPCHLIGCRGSRPALKPAAVARWLLNAHAHQCACSCVTLFLLSLPCTQPCLCIVLSLSATLLAPVPGLRLGSGIQFLTSGLTLDFGF